MEYNFAKGVASLKPSIIREILKNSGDTIPLAAGNPAPEAFPVDDVRKITADILAKDPITALQYGISEGYTPLRNTIRNYMSEKYNIYRNGDCECIHMTISLRLPPRE